MSLYYPNAHRYDSSLGRFAQADTLVPEPGNASASSAQAPQGWDRYAFVNNNPLRYTDPSGHDPCLPKHCGYMHDYDGDTPPPASYDPAESVQQARELVYQWFFEQGPSVRYFGPESSLTQDIMYDPGMKQFRKAWAKAGYPLPWSWHHSADVREGGLLPIRMAKGGLVYIRENLELGLAAMGFGSETPEGPIDPVGGIIGSLDEIHVKDVGGGLVKIEVINWMDWQSGTRVPGTNRSLIPWRFPRSAWGPGGAIVQHFYWWELLPRR